MANSESPSPLAINVVMNGALKPLAEAERDFRETWQALTTGGKPASLWAGAPQVNPTIGDVGRSLADYGQTLREHYKQGPIPRDRDTGSGPRRFVLLAEYELGWFSRLLVGDRALVELEPGALGIRTGVPAKVTTIEAIGPKAVEVRLEEIQLDGMPRWAFTLNKGQDAKVTPFDPRRAVGPGLPGTWPAIDRINAPGAPLTAGVDIGKERDRLAWCMEVSLKTLAGTGISPDDLVEIVAGDGRRYSARVAQIDMTLCNSHLRTAQIRAYEIRPLGAPEAPKWVITLGGVLAQIKRAPPATVAQYDTFLVDDPLAAAAPMTPTERHKALQWWWDAAGRHPADPGLAKAIADLCGQQPAEPPPPQPDPPLNLYRDAAGTLCLAPDPKPVPAPVALTPAEQEHARIWDLVVGCARGTNAATATPATEEDPA